ncbi:MAG: hypothetical protein HQ515_20925 [Phycisphaeraceae bacterium]|nr:hypothetical protein [Phycisphaeraceae bacterium]
MNKEPYKRQPGDYEIRLLKDGRMVLVGPDQTLLDMAKDLSSPTPGARHKERNTHDSATTGSASVTSSPNKATAEEHHD